MQVTVAATAGLRRHFSSGEIIFRQGDSGCTLLYVLSGTVRIVKNDIQIAIGGRGEFFGEMSLLENSPRFASVIAESECDAIEYNLEEFLKLVRSEPEFAVAVMRNLSHKLRDSDSTRVAELEENNEQLHSKNSELAGLNDFLGKVIDGSPAGIAIINQDGIVELLNPAGRRMFALAPQGLKSSLLQYFVESNPLQDLRTSKLSTWSGQYTINLGSVVKTIFLSVSSIRAKTDNDRYLINFEDISELIELNDQIIKLDRFASEAQMASEVAHSINNYLTVISGNLELLEHRFGPEGHEQYRRHTGIMRSSVEAIANYVEGLMSASKDTGVFARKNLADIVRVLARVLRPQKRFQNIELATNIALDFPQAVTICEAQFQQVLLNLMINAADALNAQTENQSPRIVVTLRHDADTAKIVVNISDNGPGIEPERLPDLFHRRFTTKAKGHGIGLITVRKIVELHKGEITVSSVVGKGTTFSITIPA